MNDSIAAKLILVLIAVVLVSVVAAGVIFYHSNERNDSTILRNAENAVDAAISDGASKASGGTWPFGSVSVDEQKTAPVTGMSSLVIETSSEDINLLESDNDEVKAHFYGHYSSSNKNYKPELSLETSGGTTTIKVEFKPHIGVLSFSSDLKLDVYIPRSYSSNLDIHTASGNVKAGELKLESFTCRTSSGDTHATSVNAVRAQLGSSSGNISIDGTFDSFKSESSSGNFTSDGITAKTADLRTSSGDIRFVMSGDGIELRTTSGNIVSDSLNVKTCRVETNSGVVRLKGNPGGLDASSTSGDITAEYASLASNIAVRTSSGKTMLKLPADAEFSLSFKTSSGSGRCAFPIMLNSSEERKGMEGKVGSGRNTISVSSSSGDLDIVK